MRDEDSSSGTKKSPLEGPTTRRLTDKLQISGYRLLVQRIEQGFISRDVRGFASPFIKEPTAFAVGLAIGALVIAAALVMSLFAPASRAGDAKILATKAGARYVVVDGRVHPVTNLSSARLIVGSPDNAKTVADSELGKYPRGQLMGIPGAPDEMVARSDSDSQWAVCSQYDASSELSLTRTANVATVVIAGSDAITAGANSVGDGTALLVAANKPSSEADSDDEDSTSGKELWLLYKGRRISVTDSSSALQSVLGVAKDDTDDVVSISDDLLDTIPEQQPFTQPSITREGQSSSALPQFSIGGVLTTNGVGGQEHWLVLDDGVQRIGPFVAQLLAAYGAPVSNDVSIGEISSAPRRTSVDLGAYPWDVPKVVNAPDTVCFDWSRTGEAAAVSTLIAEPGVPMSQSARDDAITLLPARDSTPQADVFYTAPGKGWLTVATGTDAKSHTAGQLWWISDAGVRYAIGAEGGNDDKIANVLKMLGLSGVEPQLVPWSIMRLLPEGPTLVPSAAKVLHATLPVDAAQAPIPEPRQLN